MTYSIVVTRTLYPESTLGATKVFVSCKQADFKEQINTSPTSHNTLAIPHFALVWRENGVTYRKRGNLYHPWKVDNADQNDNKTTTE